MSFYPNKKTNWTPEPSFSEGDLTWEQGACRAHQWRSKEVILEFELWSNPAGWNKPRENTNMPTEPRGLGKAPRSRGVPQEGRHQDGENSRDFPGGDTRMGRTAGTFPGEHVLLTHQPWTSDPQAVRQHISLVLICPICDALLRLPQELHRKCAFLPPN